MYYSEEYNKHLNENGILLEEIKYNALKGHVNLFVNLFDTEYGAYIICWDINRQNFFKNKKWCAKSKWEYQTKILKDVYYAKISTANYIYKYADGEFTKLTYQQFLNRE